MCCDLVSSRLLIMEMLFFFLVIPHPPSSTLFPYTTLFRSCSSCCARGRRYDRRHVRAARSASRAAHLAADRRDRKSTRLNSSHGYISYAVFCLKKKRSVDRATRHERRKWDVCVAPCRG